MNLNLSKSFTLSGRFFIPQTDSDWSGILCYDPNNGITLKLRNLPLSFKPSVLIQIMNGILDDKPYSCTLHNAILQKTLFTANPDGMAGISTFNIAHVYLGKCFETSQELIFDKVNFYYSNLRQWLNKPTISTKQINSDIVVTIPESIEIQGNLDNIFTFKITIANFGSYLEKSFSSNFKQNVIFSIISKSGQSITISNYLEMNKIVKYFLMFVQGRYVTEKSIICEKSTAEIYVDLVQFYNPYKPAKKLGKAEQFTHKYDPHKFETNLQKWVKKYKKMPDFFDRFYENLINEKLSPMDKFENLIQSLLFYHKAKFSDNIEDEEKYKIFFNNLLKKLDPNEKQVVERFRSAGNTLSN